MWFLTFHPPNHLLICRDGTSSNWNITLRIQNNLCTPWKVTCQSTRTTSFIWQFFLTILCVAIVHAGSWYTWQNQGWNSYLGWAAWRSFWMECTNIWGWCHSHFGMWQGHLCTVSHSKRESWKVPRQQCLKKWVLDVIAGAAKAFMTCGVAVRSSNSCCKIFMNISQILTFQYPPKGTGSKHSQSSALLGLQKGNSLVCACPYAWLSK